MKHLNCSGQGRQPPFSLGRQNWLLKLMRQYVLSGFWPQWKKVQQRKEQKIWIIGVEGKPNGKHTCMCFCPESLPSRRPSWGFSGSYRAKWELAPEIISFFSFQIHGFNNGWFQMPELIYFLTSPINHLFREVSFSKLEIGWTLAETQLTSWPCLTLGWVIQQA